MYAFQQLSVSLNATEEPEQQSAQALKAKSIHFAAKQRDGVELLGHKSSIRVHEFQLNSYIKRLNPPFRVNNGAPIQTLHLS